MKKLTLACLLLVSGTVYAADNLTSQQVKTLMIGSTIEGYNEVMKVSYSVYFSQEGKIALVTPKGKRFGNWKIADDGHFCTQFPTEQEVCTFIIPHDGGTYRRVKDDGTATHTLKKFTSGNVNNY